VPHHLGKQIHCFFTLIGKSGFFYLVYTDLSFLSTFPQLGHISITKCFFVLPKIFSFFHVDYVGIRRNCQLVHHNLVGWPFVYHCVFIAHLVKKIKVCLYLVHMSRPCTSSCTFCQLPNERLNPRELIGYPIFFPRGLQATAFASSYVVRGWHNVGPKTKRLKTMGKQISFSPTMLCVGGESRGLPISSNWGKIERTISCTKRAQRKMLNKNIEWSIKSHITMQSQNTMEPFSEQNELKC
jgi:hypothetical protein